MDKKNDASAHRYFMKVPNTDEGWQQIEAAKEGLNKDRYTLVYKYNGKSIPGVYRRSYYSCVKKYATHVRVYLNVKDNVRDREFLSRKKQEMYRKLDRLERNYHKEIKEIEDNYLYWWRNT